MGIAGDLFIDAVSGEGVRVRRIAEIRDSSSGYALDRCVVARNLDVFKSGKADGMIGPLTYLGRPYALPSILLPDRSAEDENDPVICSKLVAIIMRAQGFDLGREPRRTLPKHIDKFCNGGSWRRFPLSKYDLVQNSEIIDEQRAAYTASQLSADRVPSSAQ